MKNEVQSTTEKVNGKKVVDRKMQQPVKWYASTI
jgi:hypothetical protein